MNANTRRYLALILIIIGLLALGFGLWILWKSFFSKPSSDLNLPGRGGLATTPREPTEPKVIASPTIVEGVSTLTANDQGSDLQEAINRSSAVVSRMGSGSSQNGFLGYADVLIDGTQRFKDFVLQQQAQMRLNHPADGPLYGITTRVVSADVVSGQNGSEQIQVKVQAQVVIDSGDRTKPTEVKYEESVVMLIRQENGVYLVDYIEMRGL